MAIRHMRSVVDRISDLPLRQLTRLRAELGLAAAQFTGGIFCDQPMLAIEFGIVARICLPDWTRGRALVRPEVPTRTISIRKIALSLGSAPESTRRHINILRDQGFLTSSDEGVSLAVTAANETLLARYYLGIHDLFVRFLEDIAATCDIDLPVVETPRFGIADVIERALEILFLPIDNSRPAGTGRTAFLLWSGLTVVAVRGVAYDPVLSRRYANEIPPDSLRAGISLRKLATKLSIPYATAWRQIQALQAANLVTRIGGDQWVVLTRNLMEDSVRDIATGPTILAFRKVRELALMGLDCRRAGDYYAIGRPALADFGIAPK